jgi:hypothetical protein
LLSGKLRLPKQLKHAGKNLPHKIEVGTSNICCLPTACYTLEQNTKGTPNIHPILTLYGMCSDATQLPNVALIIDIQKQEFFYISFTAPPRIASVGSKVLHNLEPLVMHKPHLA